MSPSGEQCRRRQTLPADRTQFGDRAPVSSHRDVDARSDSIDDVSTVISEFSDGDGVHAAHGITGDTCVKGALGPPGGDLVGAGTTGELDEFLVELEPDAVVAVDAG